MPPFIEVEIICLILKEKSITNQSFQNKRSKTVLKTVLASITLRNECEKVFSDNRPHIVFHVINMSQLGTPGQQ